MNRLKKAVTKKVLAKVETLGAEAFGKELKRFEDEKSPTQWKAFILQQWLLAFNEAPPQGVGFQLLALKLKYHLNHEEAIAQGRALSQRFLRNYKAAMGLSLQGFEAELRYLLESKINAVKSTQTEEQKMANKKQAVVKAQATKAKKTEGQPKGPAKGATWVGLFQEQPKVLRTDTQIAAEFKKRMGGTVDVCEKDVVKSRGFYNFGAFGKKFPAPKVALKEYKPGAEKEAAPVKVKAKVKIKK